MGAALRLRDDRSRTSDFGDMPGEQDADQPTVDRPTAVAAVVAVLAHESEFAFGETAEWWVEVLMNNLADNQAGVLLALLIADTAPSIGKFLADHTEQAIEGHANRLLSKMDPEELERAL